MHLKSYHKTDTKFDTQLTNIILVKVILSQRFTILNKINIWNNNIQCYYLNTIIIIFNIIK